MKVTTLLAGAAIAALVIAGWTALVAIKKSDELAAHSCAERAEGEVAKYKAEVEELRQRLGHKIASGARGTKRRAEADAGAPANRTLPQPIAGLSERSVTRTNTGVVFNAHDDNPGNRESAAAEDQPTREEIAASLEDFFYSEGYDTPWANRTEGKLKSLFTRVNPEGNELLDASCRSSLCRIEVRHADTEAEERFIQAFATSGKFVADDKRGFYHVVIGEHGDRRTVFFYARRGRELPTAGAR